MNNVRRTRRPADNFTIVANAHLRDVALSWAARGLLVWLQSHAEGYDITEDVIVAAGKTGRDGIRTLLKELESAGYLRRERTYAVTGGSTVDYVLMDPRESDSATLGNDGLADLQADQAQDPLSGVDSLVSPKVVSDHPRSFTEDQEKTKTPSVSKRAVRADRGTRVPEDFMPDEKMREWYAAEGLEGLISGRIEHQKFMNYWLAKPGVAGRKTDWRRTWMNWMLQAAERNGYRVPGTAVVAISGAPYRPSTTDQKVAQTLELGRRLQAMEESSR